MEEKSCVMILLAAGNGSRMKSGTAKQFMLLGGKPLIWYSLNTVEKSALIDDCILVTGEKDIGYMRKEIVEKYDFRKVTAVVGGGSERWESVLNALSYIKEKEGTRWDYIYVHDGARPFLTEEILRRTDAAVQEYHACVAAMPVKDTIRLTDENGMVKDTPDRRNVWIIQTPQAFEAKLLLEAYEDLGRQAAKLGKKKISVTDDAGVVEQFSKQRVRLSEGSYNNIKVTTPEDMAIAEALLKA